MWKLRFVQMVLPIWVLSFGAWSSEQVIIDGSTGVKPLVEALVAKYKKSQPNAQFVMGAGMKPSARLDALRNNSISIAMASHGIDVQKIADLGLHLHRFAKMAVVMGVNQSVKVHSLTGAELCSIYSGKISNWQSLGDATQPIAVFTRPMDEVDAEVLVEQIDCFTDLVFSKGVSVFKKSGQMARAIATNKGSIGMTTMVRVAQSDGQIRALALDGILPDSVNLVDGRYPLTRDSYLITSSNAGPQVMAFVNFIRSKSGREVILANHAIPAD